jgi:alkylation response protein AidB-like acyl-CoA dehydrogenase
VTESQAGSDLGALRCTARRASDGYILNGAKAFVTHVLLADLIIVAAVVEADGHSPSGAGLSLFAVDTTQPGVGRGRPYPKMGLASLDTADLYLDNVFVPVGCRLGEEGFGSLYLMEGFSLERLSIAVSALSIAEATMARTLRALRHRLEEEHPEHTQRLRFQLADVATALRIARSFTDECVERAREDLLGIEDAAMAKVWNTELCQTVVESCIGMHDGRSDETEVLAGLAADVRVQRIYGGTSEILREVISQSVC